ncbi:MAG: glycosyltransferase, partial [Solirubrobacteraceae bacterium]
FQVVEYMSAFLSHRLAWSRLNSVLVIAGGFGIWRRDVVLELGGYATDVTHEDFELTINAHRYFRANNVPYRIVMVPDATVWTQAPTSWRDICNQRKRWQRIVLETIWKYRSMLFNPRYGSIGMLTMPYVLVYEALGAFIEAFAYVFVILLASLGLLDVQFLLLFLAFSIGLNAAIRLAGLILDVAFFNTYGRRDVVRLGLLALLEPLVYRPALLVPRMLAMREFLMGHKGHEPMTRSAMSGPEALVGREALVVEPDRQA